MPTFPTRPSVELLVPPGLVLGEEILATVVLHAKRSTPIEFVDLHIERLCLEHGSIGGEVTSTDPARSRDCDFYGLHDGRMLVLCKGDV